MFTSTSMGEDVFALVVATLGLFLLALLIGNMQVSPLDNLSKPIILTDAKNDHPCRGYPKL